MFFTVSFRLPLGVRCPNPAVVDLPKGKIPHEGRAYSCCAVTGLFRLFALLVLVGHDGAGYSTLLVGYALLAACAGTGGPAST